MKLHSLMKIGPDKRIIALVGGGGKTTALYALSRESQISFLPLTMAEMLGTPFGKISSSYFSRIQL